ncbi:MAG: hypothetical protein AB2693_01310, partial [Candidatus Thiodiazotropha sp.]
AGIIHTQQLQKYASYLSTCRQNGKIPIPLPQDNTDFCHEPYNLISNSIDINRKMNKGLHDIPRFFRFDVGKKKSRFNRFTDLRIIRASLSGQLCTK